MRCVLGITDNVDAIHLAPSGTALVVDCISRRAWLDGQLLTGVEDDQRFRWLELVAYAASSGRPLSSTDLSDELSRGSLDAHKRVKRELKQAIEKSMADAGRSMPTIPKSDLFPSQGGKLGYRVAVSVWVRGKPEVRRR